jgi:hypothetical protein
VATPQTGDPERLLAFELGDEGFAIRVVEIGGVLGCSPIRAVPGSPEFVIGLAEWRGSVITVLDLPGLLGRRGSDDPACLIRLVSPLQQTALYLPATVQLVEHTFEGEAEVASEGVVRCRTVAAELVHLVQPAALVRRVETEMRGRG